MSLPSGSPPPPLICISKDDYSAADPARQRINAKSRRFISLPNLRSPAQTKSPPLSEPPRPTEPATLISLDSTSLDAIDVFTDKYEWAVVYENQRGDGRKLELWKIWLAHYKSDNHLQTGASTSKGKGRQIQQLEAATLSNSDKDITVDDNILRRWQPPSKEDFFYPVQAALRTYALSLSLSLGPSLLPFLAALITAKTSHRTGFKALIRVLRRELGLDGFAFAMTLSVGGGAALSELWRFHVDDAKQSEPPKGHNKSLTQVSSPKRTFIVNVVSSTFGILLLQAGRRRAYLIRQGLLVPITTLPFTPPTPVSGSNVRISDTLDLTLLLLVRAVDSFLQVLIRTDATKKDYVVPPEVDPSKTRGTEEAAVLFTSRIDAFVFWYRLPRSYVKWIATLANLDSRVIKALKLLRLGNWSYINGSAAHSTVLTGFSQELGYSASLGDPALLPAYGGAVADAAWKTLGVKNRRGVGGLPCELVHGSVGSSLGLEGSCTANSSIRGAMAFLEAIAIYLPAHFLPVLLTRPKTLLKPHRAMSTLFGALQSATFLSTFVTLAAFILSFATLVTAATHRPDTLRGLSRWTLSFVFNGPYAGFWKQKRRDPSIPPTPVAPPTPKAAELVDPLLDTSAINLLDTPA
ncbi:hypothetical protein H0H87_000167 [Tephrocybe sp. NHM501043]|nr:hypothetical protein H0H87_000167 [Tephrocybe sp. NHM501043]